MCDRFPKVTVFMPVYNTSESFLRAAIESILTQTYYNFELLILNDGSLPPVKDIILSYSDPRIRYEENDGNCGLPFTRNRGMELARGEYVALMDSDDISMPDRLEKQVTFLDSHPEYGVYSGACQCIGKKNSLEHAQTQDHPEIKILLGLEDCIANPTVMMRLSCIRTNHIIYGNYAVAQDYDFFTKMVFYTKIYNTSDVFLVYRWHDGNVSNRYKDEQYKNANIIRIFYTVRLYDISLEKAKILNDSHSNFSELWPIVHEIWMKSPNDEKKFIEKYYFGLIYHCFMKSWRISSRNNIWLKKYHQSKFYELLSLRRKYKVCLFSFLSKIIFIKKKF